MADRQPQLGDIVLFTQTDGTQVPAIITSILSAASVTLDTFGVGGVGGSTEPVVKGSASGQWDFRPNEKH